MDLISVIIVLVVVGVVLMEDAARSPVYECCIGFCARFRTYSSHRANRFHQCAPTHGSQLRLGLSLWLEDAFRRAG